MQRDFFISFNKADRQWASWIAWTLEEAGYTVFFQDWDFGIGSNFVLKMDEASRQSRATILVLSDNYLAAKFPTAEWAAAFALDPVGEHRKLLPVRVRDCRPEGLLGPLVYVDLAGVADEDEARGKLLAAVGPDRAKPKNAVRFPSSAASAFHETRASASGPEPTLWVYLNLPTENAESDRAQIVSAVQTLGDVRILRAQESDGLEMADLAIFVIGMTAPEGKSLASLKADVDTAARKGIPHRMYTCESPFASGDSIREWHNRAARENWPKPVVYLNTGDLSNLIRADMARIRSGLRMASDTDWYQSGEHREVLVAIRKGNYRQAHNLVMDLLTRRPYSPRGRYNLACILSTRAAASTSAKLREKSLDEAQESLATALKYGFTEFIRSAVLVPDAGYQDAVNCILTDQHLEPLFTARPELRVYLQKDQPGRLFIKRRVEGCIEASMPVDVSRDAAAPMASIAEGDEIATWNEASRRPESGIVERADHHIVSELLIINGGIRVTPFHPLLTADGWRTAANLATGDVLIASNGLAHVVESKLYMRGRFFVCDIRVTPHANFSVRGIVAHNKF
jgi:hypothetical protein